MNEEDFKKAASKKHEAKYSYENSSYTKLNSSIVIDCPKHGLFTQNARKHLQGQGCPKCALKSITLTWEDFLYKARKTHGNTYSYDKDSFSKSTSKIKIRCSMHGVFEQLAYKHYGGQGCPECGKEKSIFKQTMTFKEFKERATSLFGDRYFYEEDSFVRGSKSVVIICRIHGKFKKNASLHLTGSNCPKCAFITSVRKAARKNTISFEEFVRRSKLIFNDKYCYDEKFYKKMSALTSVECPEHGVFEVLALEHTRGQGCPNCSLARSKSELLIRGLLTEIGIVFKEQWSPVELRESSGKNLRFDFFLPEFKVIIEFDGRHHFEPCFSSDETVALEVFRRTVENDLIKNEWAESNGYFLYRLMNEKTLKKDLLKTLSEYVNFNFSSNTRNSIESASVVAAE